MTESAFSVIPIAAVFGALAGFLTTMLRESYVTKREDRRVRLELTWKYKEARIDKLMGLTKQMPLFALNRDDQGNFDAKATVESCILLVNWTASDVEPFLQADSYHAVYEKRKQLSGLYANLSYQFYELNKEDQLKRTNQFIHESGELRKIVEEQIRTQIDEAMKDLQSFELLSSKR